MTWGNVFPLEIDLETSARRGVVADGARREWNGEAAERKIEGENPSFNAEDGFHAVKRWVPGGRVSNP